MYESPSLPLSILLCPQKRASRGCKSAVNARLLLGPRFRGDSEIVTEKQCLRKIRTLPSAFAGEAERSVIPTNRQPLEIGGRSEPRTRRAVPGPASNAEIARFDLVVAPQFLRRRRIDDASLFEDV